MTVQYQGNSLWSLYIEGRKIDLTDSEIEKIQEYDFEANEVAKSVPELQDTIARLEELLEDRQEIVNGYEDEIAKLNNYLKEALDGK